MFGFLRKKPRWSLVFWNMRTKDHYSLESDSIGTLIGYVATEIEQGKRPSAVWKVHFVHRNLERLEISLRWPIDKDPISQIITASLQIDHRLRRASEEPKLFRLTEEKRDLLPLLPSIGGQVVWEISIADRFKLAEHGAQEDSQLNIYKIVDEVFTNRYGEQPADARSIVYFRTHEQ